MSPYLFLALAGAVLILAIAPGPGVFITVARAGASGFCRAAAVVAGIVLGDLIFLLFAAYGLSTIAENLHSLFLVIKYAGAAYLVYLGIMLWWQAPGDNAVKELGAVSWQSDFMSGLFTTLGNPKVILFYLGFLPAFVEFSALSLLDIGAIALVVTFVLGGTLLVYAYLASCLRKYLMEPDSQKLINRMAAGVMVATGMAVAAKA